MEEASSSSSLSIAEDVFEQRYQAGVSLAHGTWHALPRLALQLEPAAAAGAAASTSGRSSTTSSSRAGPPPRTRSRLAAAPRPASAAAALPQHEPWLLAAGEYASAAANGWQQQQQPAAAAGRASRARMLFQYKPYSQQEPLSLRDADVAAVLEAVFGRASGGPSAFQVRRWLALQPCCWAPFERCRQPAAANGVLSGLL
jgi:hypothetical protein